MSVGSIPISQVFMALFATQQLGLHSGGSTLHSTSTGVNTWSSRLAGDHHSFLHTPTRNDLSQMEKKAV